MHITGTKVWLTSDIPGLGVGVSVCLINIPRVFKPLVDVSQHFSVELDENIENQKRSKKDQNTKKVCQVDVRSIEWGVMGRRCIGVGVSQPFSIHPQCLYNASISLPKHPQMLWGHTRASYLEKNRKKKFFFPMVGKKMCQKFSEISPFFFISPPHPYPARI